MNAQLVRIATAAGGAVVALVAIATPALAADAPTGRPALPDDLTYRTTTWTSQGADMSISAPEGWMFALTPDGQARFNAAGRADVLAMGYRGDSDLRAQLTDKLAALRGTPGLRILTSHARGRGDSAVGELRYRWEPASGGTRFVAYRYQGDDAYMVAGPIADREGLRAVLATASATGECS